MSSFTPTKPLHRHLQELLEASDVSIDQVEAYRRTLTDTPSVGLLRAMRLHPLLFLFPTLGAIGGALIGYPVLSGVALLLCAWFFMSIAPLLWERVTERMTMRDMRPLVYQSRYVTDWRALADKVWLDQPHKPASIREFLSDACQSPERLSREAHLLFWLWVSDVVACSESDSFINTGLTGDPVVSA